MKKSLLCICSLLLIATSIQAADYLEDYSSIRKGVRRLLGADSVTNTYCTDVELNTFIRQAVVDIPNVAQAIKGLDTVITTRFKSTYALDSTTLGIRDVAWIKDGYYKTMVRVPKAQFYNQPHKDTRFIGPDDANYEYLTRPSYYDFDDDYLYLSPPPKNSGDTIEIAIWKKMASVASDTTLSEIDQRYRTSLLYHTAFLAANSRGDARADRFWQLYVQFRNELLNAMGKPVETTTATGN